MISTKRCLGKRAHGPPKPRPTLLPDPCDLDFFIVVLKMLSNINNPGAILHRVEKVLGHRVIYL